ncbi:D-Tyr-tRNATyr deacylase [Ignavibacterium album JCM 16511]|uniref:D-aminoacyl-tRNA deacylase n=1 Tax=Ignavibacterium album (strain DSM 19864 / JCM 16511 / NBRC 101810 / Mat9-16) TaxID=945713 RepID=I0AKC4_IGNAJ|nr:D-aminoacyl-tRNA deacylase [Ignavibacterium album]AFH49431.1 D-Tyr-tRNATyr deacylase [Ignavibacterium album JCM 16511]
MKVVVQKVSEAGVYIENEDYSAEIRKGLVILLGIKYDDTIEDVNFLADKCSNLRIFPDENEKMNLSVKDVDGEVLVISQFTLYGDAQRGNRPSFTEAARPDTAIPLYEKFIQRMKENLGESKVKSGIFGAMMLVKIFNDGPVTILIDSRKSEKS